LLQPQNARLVQPDGKADTLQAWRLRAAHTTYRRANVAFLMIGGRRRRDELLSLVCCQRRSDCLRVICLAGSD
jgi:hypothetical protein